MPNPELIRRHIVQTADVQLGTNLSLLYITKNIRAGHFDHYYMPPLKLLASLFTLQALKSQFTDFQKGFPLTSPFTNFKNLAL